MRWHPLALRDATLIGNKPLFVAAVDPGEETGLTLLGCDRHGHVRCATGTVTVKHPAAWRPVVDVLDDLLTDAYLHAPEWFGRDARRLSWDIACELSRVHIRQGEATWAQVTAANDLGPTAYRAGTVCAALAYLLGVADEPAAYHPQQWREVIHAARAQKDIAKALALGFVAEHFGAEWPVPDSVKDEKRAEWERDHWSHEAEAALIGLWHLRCLRGTDRQAARLSLPGGGNGRGKGKRPLPEAVLAAMDARGA